MYWAEYVLAYAASCCERKFHDQTFEDALKHLTSHLNKVNGSHGNALTAVKHVDARLKCPNEVNSIHTQVDAFLLFQSQNITILKPQIKNPNCTSEAFQPIDSIQQQKYLDELSQLHSRAHHSKHLKDLSALFNTQVWTLTCPCRQHSNHFPCRGEGHESLPYLLSNPLKRRIKEDDTPMRPRRGLKKMRYFLNGV